MKALLGFPKPDVVGSATANYTRRFSNNNQANKWSNNRNGRNPNTQHRAVAAIIKDSIIINAVAMDSKPSLRIVCQLCDQQGHTAKKCPCARPAQTQDPVANSSRSHPMTTRSQNNIFKPKQLYATTKHPLPNSLEPTCVPKAICDPQWRSAMSDEFKALIRNGTGHVPPLPAKNVVGCKWSCEATPGRKH